MEIPVVKSIKMPKFNPKQVYKFSYRKYNKNEFTDRHHNYNFEFIAELPGDGVTHYLFRNTTGHYNITFTERDFLCGDVRAI